MSEVCRVRLDPMGDLLANEPFGGHRAPLVHSVIGHARQHTLDDVFDGGFDSVADAVSAPRADAFARRRATRRMHSRATACAARAVRSAASSGGGTTTSTAAAATATVNIGSAGWRHERWSKHGRGWRSDDRRRWSAQRPVPCSGAASATGAGGGAGTGAGKLHHRRRHDWASASPSATRSMGSASLNVGRQSGVGRGHQTRVAPARWFRSDRANRDKVVAGSARSSCRSPTKSVIGAGSGQSRQRHVEDSSSEIKRINRWGRSLHRRRLWRAAPMR